MFLRRSLTALAAGVVALAPPAAEAQPAGATATAGDQTPRAMTLPEALAWARAHQAAVLAARARIAAGEADTRIPAARRLPTLAGGLEALGGTANNTTASTLPPPGVDIPRIGGTRVTSPDGAGLSPRASTLVALGLRQELLDFGRASAQIAVAEQLLRAERARSDDDDLSVTYAVMEAYFGVHAARAIRVASEQAYARAGAHRDWLAANVKGGLRPQVELARVDADLARYDVARLRAQGTVRTSRAAFAEAVGVDELELDAAGEAPEPSVLPPFSVALQLLSQRSPALAMARARLATQAAITQAIDVETRPDLMATATVSGRAGGAVPSSGSADGHWGALPDVPNWDVGLVFSLPLYDPVVRARRDSSRVREEVGKAEVALVTRQQLAALERAYVDAEVSAAAIPALVRSTEAAQASYAQTEARFKAGLATGVELADAEAVRTDAEIDLAVGRFQAARARAFLGRVAAEAAPDGPDRGKNPGRS